MALREIIRMVRYGLAEEPPLGILRGAKGALRQLIEGWTGI